MTLTASPHIPVMLQESVDLLRLRGDGVYVDATVGAGGHAEHIAARLTSGRLIGLDRDPTALVLARQRLAPYACVSLHQANYSELRSVLDACGVDAVDGVLIDAGVSSMQLDTADRGFSFQLDGPLDMRMDTTASVDAAAWLARASREELESALRRYGDVGPVGRIAKAILARRDANRLKRTSDLAAAVAEALPFVSSTPDEVRTVFQAVRMAVNEELKHLELGLRQAAQALAPGGRLAAIAFHSGEDRVVKQVFRDLTRPQTRLLPDGRVLEREAPLLRLVLTKPLTPSASEILLNPRAKSAKLRVVERMEMG